MQIDPILLSEEKYTGYRLIPIKNYQVKKLKKEVEKIAKSAVPILDEMDKILKDGLDEYQKKIQEHQKAVKELQADPKYLELNEQYKVLLKRVELKENRANLIKNKLQPLVDAELKGQLGEFDKPLQVVTENGQIYVQVADEIEEFIKNKRKNAPVK